MSKMTLVRNDYNYALTFNVKEYDETAYDLGSDTIILKVALPDASGLTFSGGCTITDAEAGICTYTVGATDFTTSAEYEAELEISGSQVVTAKLDNIIIIDDLP